MSPLVADPDGILRAENERLGQELIRLQRENARLSGELATALRENRDLPAGGIPSSRATGVQSPIAAAADAVAMGASAFSLLELEDDLSIISREARANAGEAAIGSRADGRLRSVGFATSGGYEEAIRRGVPARTHALYVGILRDRFGMGGDYLARLPGPALPTSLPEGRGVTHVPTGTSLFDRPPHERRFLVGDAARSPIAATSPPPSDPPARPRPPRVMQLRAGVVPVRRAPLALASGAGPVISTSPAAPTFARRDAGDAVNKETAADESERSGDDAMRRFALLELD